METKAVIKLDTVYARNPDFVARNIGEEKILVPISEGASDLAHIYTLNEVASFVWNAIDGSRTVGQLVEEIILAFDVSRDQAEKDLLEFLEQMAAIDAIQQVS